MSKPKPNNSRSAESAEETRRYYVYTLTDPRDGMVFYIGKGQGGRMHQHVSETKRGVGLNLAKEDRIKNILAAGLLPHARAIAHFDDEEEAVIFESKEINSRPGLTNIKSHGAATSQGARRAMKVRQIRRMLDNFKPYHLWVRERPREGWEREMARNVFHELVRCVQNPDRTANAIERGKDGKWRLRWEPDDAPVHPVCR